MEIGNNKRHVLHSGAFQIVGNHLRKLANEKFLLIWPSDSDRGWLNCSIHWSQYCIRGPSPTCYYLLQKVIGDCSFNWETLHSNGCPAMFATIHSNGFSLIQLMDSNGNFAHLLKPWLSWMRNQQMSAIQRSSAFERPPNPGTYECWGRGGCFMVHYDGSNVGPTICSRALTLRAQLRPAHMARSMYFLCMLISIKGPNHLVVRPYT